MEELTETATANTTVAEAPPSPDPETASPSAEVEGKKKDRVLVVDDEAQVREIVCRWLDADGYRCDKAEDAAAALAKLEEREYSLLVCDITMPGMDGIELLERARSEHPDLAVIMITGVDDRDTALQCLQLGAFGYVIKPFDENEVLITAASALERRRLQMFQNKYIERREEEVRKRTEELRRREEEVALRLVWASEYRDSETGAHIRRVGRYAEMMATALGWPRNRIELIRVAALMHDVGKIGIPDSILLKPGPLIPEEFELMKKHTEIGASILGGSRTPLLQLAEEIALTHHERWDGKGYPRGLVGDQIPESGRIVAMIDVYDSLTHDRVYRPAFSEEKAIKMMSAERGKQFDPEMFATFLELVPKFREIRERVSMGL